uniref:Uncharacterized protein n=1 Tax=Anguilla anguilla TaxID=7936 RepID=A0A0E9Q1K8_ANGAN
MIGDKLRGLPSSLPHHQLP